MTRQSLRTLAASAVLAAATVPAALVVTAPAADAAVCPSPPVKCFRVDLSPAHFVAGSTVQLTETLTNESGGQSLGSSNLDAPGGYTITHVDASSQGTSNLGSNEVQLRNLSLASGASVTVTFTVQAPSSNGTSVWGASAKQSNDYNGTGNDFVLDPLSQLGTTTTDGSGGGSGGTPACSATDVSCGTNFIDYSKHSSVSTGHSVNASVWLVGTMDFPATNQSGGQLYSMSAPNQPANACPVNGSPTQCTFEMDVDTIPAPYTSSFPATLTLLCDSSHCGAGAYLLFKRDASGNVTPLLPCPLSVVGPCSSFSTNTDGDTVVTISNITAGDPQFFGINIG